MTRNRQTRLKRTRTRRCAHARVCGRTVMHPALNRAYVGSTPSRPTEGMMRGRSAESSTRPSRNLWKVNLSGTGAAC
jgi:hypothetical protein